MQDVFEAIWGNIYSSASSISRCACCHTAYDNAESKASTRVGVLRPAAVTRTPRCEDRLKPGSCTNRLRVETDRLAWFGCPLGRGDEHAVYAQHRPTAEKMTWMLSGYARDEQSDEVGEGQDDEFPAKRLVG
jgi:hypothetical protein